MENMGNMHLQLQKHNNIQTNDKDMYRDTTHDFEPLCEKARHGSEQAKPCGTEAIQNLKEEETSRSDQESKPSGSETQSQSDCSDQVTKSGAKTRQDYQRYAGLRNQGATCYLNAVLQTLFMTEDFRNAVESSQDKKNALALELAQLFKSLMSKRKCGTTEKITNVLEIVNVHEQQDAMIWFFRILKMVGPEMSKTFQGIMEYNTTCKNPNTEHTSMRQTDFFSLPISMESHPPINVQSCFNLLFEPVYMREENKLYCRTCEDMMDMEIICKIETFPPVLVLHLKRFELDFSTMHYKKNNSTVEIPLQLLVKGKSGEDHDYDLYAVIKHVGLLKGGHYSANIKSPENQHWYRFNDFMVEEIPDFRTSSKDAYLLFYKSAALEGAGLPIHDPKISGQDSSEETLVKTKHDQEVAEGKISSESGYKSSSSPEKHNDPSGTPQEATPSVMRNHSAQTLQSEANAREGKETTPEMKPKESSGSKCDDLPESSSPPESTELSTLV